MGVAPPDMEVWCVDALFLDGKNYPWVCDTEQQACEYAQTLMDKVQSPICAWDMMDAEGAKHE